MLTFVLALILQVQTQNCPVRIDHLEFQASTPSVTLYISNYGDKAVTSIEFQFDDIDLERHVLLARYYLAVGKLGGSKGKPVESRRRYLLEGAISPQLAFPHRGDSIPAKQLTINIIHYDDGTTWERKDWRKEPNPNQ